ncbi:MAG: hypothetical protein IJG33_00045 [Selenomonadaceae bacterium]|nr:hypothetical protein [Selenomonadaceae bacterium]MBQ3441611.1 hypothetical protein [Selenomonadaceae bacterium]
MTSLFLAVEEAENHGESKDDYIEAICTLTKHESATRSLLNALMDAVLLHEKQWQEIEHRVDYQTKYTDREQAREDFLREYFSK